MIDWHRLSGRKGLDLILMIAVSNTSIKLTAGNLFELSLSTFGDVSKCHCISYPCNYHDSHILHPIDRWLRHQSHT